MTQRGRKSDKNKPPLASVPDLPEIAELPTRPAPPFEAGTWDHQRWLDIVNELPVNKWRRSDLLLLEELIRCEQTALELDARIVADGELIENRFGDLIPHPAIKLRLDQLAMVLRLQRALRLPPSTRTRPDAGGLRTTTPKSGKAQPWD